MRFVERPIWKIFLLQKKKNTLLTCGMIFLNMFAALSEGLSFIFILASFASLTHEPLHSQWITFFSQFTHDPFLFFLLGAVALQILRSISQYFSHSMMTALTVNIQGQIQKQLFRSIFRMEFSRSSELKKGDLLHQAIAPPSFIPMLFEEYNRLIISIFMIMTYLTIMGTISIVLTCCVLLFFLLAAVLQKFFLKSIVHASHHHAEQISVLSKKTSQSLEGLKQIHIYHQQEQTLFHMEKILDLIAKTTLRLKKWNGLIPSMNDSLGVLLVGLSLLIGTYILQRNQEAFASSLFIYLTLTYRMATRLQHFMIARGLIASYSGPLNRMEDLLTVNKKKGPEATLEAPFFKTEIQFKQVSLIYPHQENYALKNISLSIPKNKIVALVGTSGAGKSSLIDLLIGLYEPSDGIIQMDETPIQCYSRKSWLSLFGVVSQDAFLFDASIEENIRFGAHKASSEEIIKACQMAGADTFITHLPEGYHTLIGERGYRLSGGEKQRIALAQALIRNPQIILLDEATSHLDSQSEQIIQETLNHLRGEKTFLIVAHRLATIQMADLIYVLDRGHIIESGTHQQLLHLGGRYNMFWNLQKLTPATSIK